MLKENKFTVALALIAIIIAISGLYRPINIVVQAPDAPASSVTLGAGTRFPNGLSTDTTSPIAGQIRSTTLTTTGTTTQRSTTNTYSYEVKGPSTASFETAYGGTAMAAASTTCSFPNPWFNVATATLSYFSASVTANTDILTTFDVSTSTRSSGASTTSRPFMIAQPILANQLGVFAWQPGVSTSSVNTFSSALAIDGQTGRSPFTVGPTEYVNMRYATSTSDVVGKAGTCRAEFVIN